MASPARPTTRARSGRPPAPTVRGGIRLLPVMIFVVVLVLSVRINDIWKAVSGEEPARVTINQSEAQQPPPPGGRKKGQKSPQQPTDAAPAPAADAGGKEAPPAVEKAGGANEGEPPTFTQNEIEVLQKLAERREALDARSRELDLRENLVKAAEGRIDKKVVEMKALQSNIQGMLKQVDEADDGKMKSLVKIYETMKPKDAAKIFEQLDMPVLLGVLTRMKEQKVAPIMEAMDPMKAKTITDTMAVRRGARTEGQNGG
ncbi:MAG TPA: hypothetical protein HPQ04_12615 [Rhodospirillaceae bacterium]|nr:hypothetical protein [Rhodospirillaceae bacterium]